MIYDLWLMRSFNRVCACRQPGIGRFEAFSPSPFTDPLSLSLCILSLSAVKLACSPEKICKKDPYNRDGKMKRTKRQIKWSNRQEQRWSEACSPDRSAAFTIPSWSSRMTGGGWCGVGKTERRRRSAWEVGKSEREDESEFVGLTGLRVRIYQIRFKLSPNR